MDYSPNLALPYIIAAQAQKHVTHNEAIRALDALVQIAVLDRDLAAPPGSPADGARYIVAAAPAGAWSGQAGRIAAWQDSAWAFYAPREGWTAWIADEDVLVAWSGAAWVASTSLNPAPLVGVNATADTTNRLAVSSAGTLLSHAGNGHQLKVNKAAAGDTASLLLQTGFSGRAEIGLAGDDQLRIKVSADGIAWKQALLFDHANNRTGFAISTSTLAATLQVESTDTATAWFINTAAVGTGAGAGMIGYCWGTPAATNDRFGFLLFGSRGAGATFSGSGNSCGISGHAEGAWTLGTSHPSYLRFDTTTAGANSRSERLRIEAAGHVRPGADNTQTLGSSSFRWSTVYAATGTINTSDATQKTVRGPLTPAELAAWGAVTWSAYQWNDAIARKGDAARLHTGLLAKQVAAAFTEHGLDVRRYGLFCEDDEVETIVVGHDADGTPLTEARPTGSKRLGLRYDQALAFEAAWQRAHIAALEASINQLQIVHSRVMG